MTSYSQRNTHSGETVEYQGRVSWAAALLPGVLIFVLAFYLAAVSLVDLSGFVGLVAVVYLIRGVLLRLTAEYVVTDRRVIGKYGLVRRLSVDVLFTSISGISTSYSFFGRFFRYGNVVVNGAGTRSLLRNISNPRGFEAAVHRRLDDSRLLKGTAAYTLKVEMADPSPSPMQTVPSTAGGGSFCSQCGSQVGAGARFCAGCGSAVA